ncbi:MAG: 3-phenylpropionate/cinnamic acid dioxygenase small subunit [Candidatus Nanohaloarchaea archaeon]|jgi:3-phenylpropionate/cinnamic acid dioxygenase small subunit
MKGQAINIDWAVGLSLFIVTSLSSIVLIGGADLDPSSSLENVEFDVQQDLREESSIKARQNYLYTNTPNSIQNIPIDRTYVYSTAAASSISDQAFYLNPGENRFIGVVDTQDNYSFTYFPENITENSYSTDLQTGSNWINNSVISVKTGSSGVKSVKLGSRTFLDEILIDETQNLKQEKLFVDAFSGNLTVYNDSAEFQVKDKNFQASAGNYSTLYWYPEGTESLEGRTGEIKSGKTQGFTLANSSRGVTFTGDLEVEITKPDESTVNLEINSGKTRVRLHNTGTGFGEERIENQAEGNIFFGAENHRNIFSIEKLEALDNLTAGEFEQRLNLENIGYRINVSQSGENIFLRGGEIPPLTDAFVNSRIIQAVSRNGTTKQAEIEVGVWQ